MSLLARLSEGQKSQALLKARGQVKLDGSNLVRITEEHYEKALDFLCHHFHRDEPLYRSTGSTFGEDAREIYLKEICQNISVMIVNDASGEIMSLVTNKIVRKGQIQEEAEEFECDKLKVVWDFMDICEVKSNLFEHFKVNEAVELASLATNRKYRRRGLATKVVQAALAMIRNFGVGKICVKAEGSCKYSQNIFEKEGFVCLYKGIFNDYELNGRKVFEGIRIHKSFNTYGMMVSS